MKPRALIKRVHKKDKVEERALILDYIPQRKGPVLYLSEPGAFIHLVTFSSEQQANDFMDVLQEFFHVGIADASVS